MAIGPEIEIHRDVEIRYGYDVLSDKYYAHITVPDPLNEANPLSRVRRLSRTALPGAHYIGDSHSLPALLEAMRREIDQFLDV